MELHHKLRRDPSWHPNACNICGQLGHQAAQCNVGTINWRQLYGEAAFRLTPTVFQSDIDAVQRARTVDYTKLDEAARSWAKRRQEQLDNPEAQLLMGMEPGMMPPPGAMHHLPPAYGTMPLAAMPVMPRPESADGATATAPLTAGTGGPGPEAGGADTTTATPAGGAAAVPPPAVPPPTGPPPEVLPAGWAATKDGSGKTYYWHRVTKKTQWTKPTAETPIN